jgi:hypothetical protein
VIAGVPLWRAFIGMPTLHPQWGGYSYPNFHNSVPEKNFSTAMALIRQH